MPTASGVANITALNTWIADNPYTRVYNISDTGSGITFMFDNLPQPGQNYVNRDIVSTENQVNKPGASY